MATEKKAAGSPADPGQRPDQRERFVLRGGSDDRPHAVPPEPEPAVNLEEVLRRLEWPERRRTHRQTPL